MSKKKNAELSRMWGFAGKRHWLTIASCILAGISTVLSIIPFVCIWFVIRDILYAMKKGDLSLAASSGHYAWLAVAFSLLSILLYFVALCCSHLAAFRTATNMKKEAMHHIVTLPLGYFSQNASGRLRKIIDDNAGLTEGFLAHQLPDLTGAVVMPVAVISLLFVFDWRLGICCLIPLAISVFFLKKMMGGDNADFMSGYMTALENMNKEAVEFVRGIPVVKVFQQTIYSFKNFHAAIAFEGLTSGKTVLMIAHRLSTIQDADMILVFGDGKIIERGNHDELLKQNGVYASMWKEYQTQIIWKVGTTVRKEENHD